MRRSPAWDVIWVGLAFRTGPAALAVDSNLLPVSAGILGLVGLVCGLRGLRREDTEAEQEGSWAAGGIFIPQLFYLISTFTYFRHVFHFQQFLWALVPAAAWQLQRLPIRFRTGFTLLWVPGALLVIRSAFLTTPWKLVEPLQFPSGGSIVVDAGIKAKLTLLSGMAAEGTVPGITGSSLVLTISAASRHKLRGLLAPRTTKDRGWLSRISRQAPRSAVRKARAGIDIFRAMVAHTCGLSRHATSGPLAEDAPSRQPG